MRTRHFITALIALTASITTMSAQERVASTPGTTPRTAAAASKAQTAMDQAAAAKKFTFLFFWKEQNTPTDKAWSAVQPTLEKLADSAVLVSVQSTDPAEKAILDKYGISRSPLPLVLVVAPCGAVTKAFSKTFDEDQLRSALVSSCT
jgi:hypothetical protein